MEILKRTIGLLGMLATLYGAAGSPAYADTQLLLLEQKIKAGLLYNFIKHTSWPAMQENADASRPIAVCVYGEDDFVNYLLPMEGRTVNQRKLFLQQINTIPEAERCDIVFVTEQERENWAEMRRFLHARNILTVSDFPEFAQNGGMIEFREKDKHIGAIFNLEAFGNAGLDVSPSLLNLNGVEILSASMQEP